MLTPGSEQARHLDKKIAAYDQQKINWPTEVNNCLLNRTLPVYDQEYVIAINSSHSSDLDILRQSGENRIRQLEGEQKRASVAIIKARENRQRKLIRLFYF